MVNVAWVVSVLPQSSVAVKVTVAAPVAPHRSDRPEKLSDHVTFPQVSEAAPVVPFDASHALSSAVLPLPSHSTVRSEAAVSIVGGVVSSMVNVAWVVSVLPQSSVAVKITVAAPVAPHRSVRAEKSCENVTVPQVSEAAPVPPFDASHALSSAVLPLPSHSTVKFEAAVSIVGGVESIAMLVSVRLSGDARSPLTSAILLGGVFARNATELVHESATSGVNSSVTSVIGVPPTTTGPCAANWLMPAARLMIPAEGLTLPGAMSSRPKFARSYVALTNCISDDG